MFYFDIEGAWPLVDLPVSPEEAFLGFIIHLNMTTCIFFLWDQIQSIFQKTLTA